MTTVAIALVVFLFAVLTLALAFLKAKAGRGASTGPDNVYELRGAILTKAERSFLGALEEALPSGVGLLAKVRLGDIFQPKKGLNPSARTKAGNRINSKHVDFLLVRASDLVPMAGIELDDASHARRDRQNRDEFVNAVFRSASLPLLHIPAQSSYSVAALKTTLALQLAASTAPRD